MAPKANNMKRRIILMLSLFIVGAVNAQESLLKFTPSGESTASVAAASTDISGVVTVPVKTVIDGKEYAVTSVEDRGFYLCKDLEEVILPEGLERIGIYAFFNSGIKRINIPASTKYLEMDLFCGCTLLESVQVREGNTVYSVHDGILMGNTNYYSEKAIVFVPSQLDISNYVIPDDVGQIRESAFQHNKSLKRIVIPPNVVRIFEDAFIGCENLEEVEWQTPVEEIPTCCFQGCSSLKSFVIPETVKKVGQQAFWECNSLRSITIRQGSPIEAHVYSFGVSGSKIYNDATLFVPKGSAKYYRAADVWKNFIHIEEIDMPGVEVPENHYLSLNENQLVLGYFRGEDCHSPYDLYGGADADTHYAYIGFDKEWMTPFKGNSIRNVRFALKDTASVYDVKVFIGSEQLKSDLCLQEVASPKSGWNEVELQQPYLITGDSIFVGVQFRLREFRDYPIAWVRGGESGSFYRYGPVYENGDLVHCLYDWGNDYLYALCIQCLVEGSQIPKNAVRYAGLDVDKKYYKQGDAITGYLSVRNIGKDPVEELKMTAYLDGEECTLSNSYQGVIEDDPRMQYLYYEIPLDKFYASGKKLLSVDVQTINGMPNTYVGDKNHQQTIKYYTQSMKRDKVLVELFSSWGCGYSYWGFESVGALKHQFPEVSCVLYYRGAPEDICEEYIGALITGFPTVYINRYASPGAQSLNENNSGTESAIKTLEEAKARPAFANVNIASQYDENSRKLQVKVSGIRNEDFLPVEGYTHLNIHLVEDDVVIKGWGDETEIHDDILRGCMTDIWGDLVEWNADSYEMNYSMELPASWNPEKMRIIAFLSRPWKGNNYEEMDVLNCNETELGGNSISNIGDLIVDKQRVPHEGIYNLNGQYVCNDVHLLPTLPPGIYIVNGKKCVVKYPKH